jgi:hypothetical protein
MKPSDFYHKRAVECLLLGDEMSDLHEREVMHELAACWLRLVERAEERKRQNSERGQDEAA